MAFLLYHTVPAGTCKDRVKFADFECGLMRSIRKADPMKAKDDLPEFIRSSVPQPSRRSRRLFSSVLPYSL